MDPTQTQAIQEYPRYKCHKEVSACQINSVEHSADGSMILHLAGGFPKVVIPHEEARRKPKPEAGWFMVIYRDGYRSFSPAKEFAEGYTPISQNTGGLAGRNAIADQGGNNVVAFESAVRWRQYAASLEHALMAKGVPLSAMAANPARTTPPTDAEMDVPWPTPGSGANQAQVEKGTAAGSEFGRRRGDVPGQGSGELGESEEAGELDEVAASSTG